MSKEKLLLHSCCGPCSSAVIERLYPDYDITIYYYNPNIFPMEEYNHRLATQKQLLEALPYGSEIKLVPGVYDPDMFDELAEGFENCPEGGERCKICFKMRLSGAIRYAKENGFNLVTTTLSVSPHKNAQVINEIGEALCRDAGLCWLHSDFKKQNGFLRTTELSKEYNLYRQDYCGCKYSMRENH